MNESSQLIKGGNVVLLTPNAFRKLTPADLRIGLRRHRKSDWGMITLERRAENLRSGGEASEIVSAYRSALGSPFLVVTLGSSTAICMVEDDKVGQVV